MASTMHTQMFDCDRIRQRAGYRPCVEDEELESLIASLEAVGQLHPIVVSPEGDHFRIVTGSRVFRAVQILGHAQVWCAVAEQTLSDAEELQLALVSDTQRKALGPVELGEQIVTLMKLTGWKATEVADRLGYSNATVSRLRAIAALPDDVKERVKGAISLRDAYDLAKEWKGGQLTGSGLPPVMPGGDGPRLAIAPDRRKRKRHVTNAVPRIVLDLETGGTITAEGNEFASLVDVSRSLKEAAAKLDQAIAEGNGLTMFEQLPKAG